MKDSVILDALRKKNLSDQALIQYLVCQLEALEQVLEKHLPDLYNDYQKELYDQLQKKNVQDLQSRRSELEE